MSVAEATQRINDILRSLEVSTGSVVESIGLRNMLDALTRAMPCQ